MNQNHLTLPEGGAGGSLVVIVEAPTADFAAFATLADSVVGSLDFTP